MGKRSELQLQAAGRPDWGVSAGWWSAPFQSTVTNMRLDQGTCFTSMASSTPCGGAEDSSADSCWRLTSPHRQVQVRRPRACTSPADVSCMPCRVTYTLLKLDKAVSPGSGSAAAGTKLLDPPDSCAVSCAAAASMGFTWARCTSGAWRQVPLVRTASRPPYACRQPARSSVEAPASCNSWTWCELSSYKQHHQGVCCCDNASTTHSVL